MPRVVDAVAGLAADPRKAALVLALTAAAAANPDDAEALYGLLTRPSHQLVTVRLSRHSEVRFFGDVIS